MRIYISFVMLLLCSIIGKTMATNVPVQTTDANLFGHVVDVKTGEHLPYVTVLVSGTTIATTTDATGHYMLKDLPLGKQTIEARYLGYETGSKEVAIEKGKAMEINFELKESTTSLDEVVVVVDRNEATRKSAANLMSILDYKMFDRTNACTVSDGLNFQPGLRVENNCQNCGFTQVRMNGLDGAYSQILLDSRPTFSALAGVYGLEQIPANMVERIEVTRGAGSALLGASAIAGTVNIITKEPSRNSAQLSHSLTSIGGSNSFDNNTSLNVSLVSDDQKMGVMAYGQTRHRSAYDHDGDSFSEIPQLESHTLGFRSYLKTGTYSKITFEYHNMYEYRRGGDNLKKQPFEAYIAEQIESKINGGNVKYDWFSPDAKHKFSVYTAAQLTNRDSYYGGGDPVGILTGNETQDEIDNYNDRLNSYGHTKDVVVNLGGQYSYQFDKLLFMPSTLTAGAEYTYNKLDDQSGYREEAISQEIDIAAMYIQNEWQNEKWGFLLGTRLDKHKLLDHAVFSPRANVRYNPIKDMNIRLSYGQGFRAPQLYDEDLHVEISGGQAITQVRDPHLKEERSHSLSGSADYYLFLGRNQLNFMAEGFYTKLNNPFTTVSEEQPDGSIIRTIVNASGAKVYGLTLEARAATTAQLEFQLGATFQQSRYDEARKWSGDDTDDDVDPTKRMMRTPNVYGYFVTTWMPTKRFNTSLSGTYTGSMYVPHEAGVIERNRTEKSPSFFDMNWKFSYRFPIQKSAELELNAGVQNIFNAYQKDFDKGPDRASSYIYGPSLPRSYFAGVRINI